MTINVDPIEVEKFSQLAHRWWDPHSEFKALHAINPLRLDYIDKIIPLAGKTVLDIGCGGGLLSEAMAVRGATVTGIDLGEKALKVAQLHSLETAIAVDYREIAAEQLASEQPHYYDVITCMEMLEHVPSPKSVVQACADLVKLGGHIFFSTINRNPKSYLFAVIGAEYILNLLPRGTHDYAKFIQPTELAKMNREAKLTVERITGMSYNPITQIYSLGSDVSVNYLMHCLSD